MIVTGSDVSKSVVIFKRDPRKECKNVSGIVTDLGVGVGAGGGRSVRFLFDMTTCLTSFSLDMTDCKQRIREEKECAKFGSPVDTWY